MTQDDNSAALANQQQIEHQQCLLTKKEFLTWLFDAKGILTSVRGLQLDYVEEYLKEYGLPLDSVIEGL